VAVTGAFSIDFSGLPDTNPYSNADFIKADPSSTARIVSGVFRAVNNNTPAAFLLDPVKWVPGDALTVKIELSTAGGGADSINAGVLDASGNGYVVWINGWGIQRRRMDGGSEAAGGADAWDATRAMSNGDEVVVSYNKANGAFSVSVNGTPVTELNGTFITHADKDLMPYFGPRPGNDGAGGIISLAVDGVTSSSASPPVISSATPSGTIGTANSATVGCTTDTEEGTLYAVLSETNNVSTASGTQIKAGQNSTSAAADFADDAAVTDSTPEVAFSGLDPETTYYYALVQETTEGFSNVLSGSFTTAAAPITAAYIRETLIDKLGDPVASVTGITMAVYHAVPTEAAPNPHEVIEDVATDSDGEIEVEIDLGDLEEGDPVWIALFKDGGTPAGTLKKVTPEYE
jgi:hypothetical protein